MSDRRRTRILLATLACTWLGCAVTENLRHPPAPALDGLTTLDGQPLALEDYAGKVLLVEFWASWCGPCHAAFPHLQEAYEQYKDDSNVAFLVVNVSWNDTPERAAWYLSRQRFTFPAAWDDGGRLARAFGVTSIPATFVLGPEGRIRFKKTGFDAASAAGLYRKPLDEQLRRSREAEATQ